VPNRFDHFPKFELDIIWQALYNHRESLIQKDGAFDFEVSDVTKLIDELYTAENWRGSRTSNV
jgi:hypothetical protein